MLIVMSILRILLVEEYLNFSKVLAIVNEGEVFTALVAMSIVPLLETNQQYFHPVPSWKSAIESPVRL